MRALVTGAAGPAGRALIPQLLEHGLTVVSADMIPHTPPGVLATVKVPAASDPGMLDVLRRTVAKYDVDVVIPTVSDELPQIAAAKSGFGQGVQVVIGAAGPVAIAHDKLYTAWHLATRGVPVPRFGTRSDFPNATAAFEALGSPVLIKPRVSRGGRGVLVVDHPDQLDWDHLGSHLILQEFIPGDEYAPVVFRPPSRRSVSSLVVVLKKTGLAAGRVGNATGVTRLFNGAGQDVAKVAEGAVRALGLVGPADIDVRRRADGQPVVLEVNARFGANSRSAPELLDRVLMSAREAAAEPHACA